MEYIQFTTEKVRFVQKFDHNKTLSHYKLVLAGDYMKHVNMQEIINLINYFR